MSQKKLALLNIQRCNSDGAVLLAYALEKVCSNTSWEVQNLNYKYAGRIMESNIIKNFFMKLKIVVMKKMHLNNLGGRILGRSVKKEFDLQNRNFMKFRQKYLNLTYEIKNVDDSILNDYDAFIVGSDVVWKPEIAACEDRELYFLRSVPENAIKIAYAASIGTDDEKILEKHDRYYKGAFDSLDYISIREQSMIPFIKKYTEKEVQSMIDPVFLLKEYDYRKLENNMQKNINGKPYIYLYLLGNNPNAVKEADALAKKNGFAVLAYLNDGFENADMIEAEAESALSGGPAEFLYNIRNAEYIMTDSFHATAFSILFNKKFCVFKRETISVRMSDLLDRFLLSDRLYNEAVNEKEINWKAINKKIEKEREQGMKYLMEALGNE